MKTTLPATVCSAWTASGAGALICVVSCTLACALACADVQAQAAPLPRVVPDASGGPAAAEAFRRLPVCTLAPDGRKLLTEPCRPAPPRTPMPRRAVPQTVLSMPPPSSAPVLPSQRGMPPTASPLAPSYNPGINPGAPPASSYTPLGVPPPSVVPAGVQPLRGCDAGGCRDAGGTRYQGNGPVLLDPSGRPCRTDGQWVQC